MWITQLAGELSSVEGYLTEAGLGEMLVFVQQPAYFRLSLIKPMVATG